jgi:hypothetical protein
MLAKLINRANVGVFQNRGRTGFTLELFLRPRIRNHLLRQKLQGHGPWELQVLGLVDDPHATGSDYANDAIVGNRFARQARRFQT